MSNRPHDLLEPFTYWRFTAKTVGIYVFAVTAFVALAEVSDTIKNYETALRHQRLGVLGSLSITSSPSARIVRMNGVAA